MNCKITGYTVLWDLVGTSEGRNSRPISVDIQMQEILFDDEFQAPDTLDFKCRLTVDEAKTAANIFFVTQI